MCQRKQKTETKDSYMLPCTLYNIQIIELIRLTENVKTNTEIISGNIGKKLRQKTYTAHIRKLSLIIRIYLQNT